MLLPLQKPYHRSALLLLFLFLILLSALAQAKAAAAVSLGLDRQQCQLLQQRLRQSAAPVSCEQLQVVHFSYVDFDKVRHDDGQIMVMAAVAPQVTALFEELLERGFPLAQARLIAHYQGDDDASMAANNTSAFNDRPITGGKAISLHAYGLAIDVNPLQNPYVLRNAQGEQIFSPPAGKAFGQRVASRAGSSEQVVELFAHHGFLTWGGDWKKPTDYQHFQVSRSMAERLAKLPLPQARQVFERSVMAYRSCRAAASRDSKQNSRKACAAVAG